MKTFLPHILLEWSAYAIGGALYWRGRALAIQPSESWRRLAIAASAVAGAAIGSKVLYLLDYWGTLREAPLLDWLSGKTIVGALLGGLIGVEAIKRFIGWRRSTGDAFVLPLIVGMIIGRLGCQLSDARDLTYGIPTALPWGWNYGDGVPRHPTAFYEMIALALIGALISRSRFLRATPGDRFRAFMVAYLALRLGLDFLKPPHGLPVAGVLVPDSLDGLAAIQWACIGGLAYYARDVVRWVGARRGRLAHADS